MQTLRWGVFDLRGEPERAVHVAPCYRNGLIAHGHSIDECECQPRVERYGALTVVTHHGDS